MRGLKRTLGTVILSLVLLIVLCFPVSAQSRIIPHYQAHWKTTFDVGSAYAGIEYYIDYFKGGVNLYSSDYCDFYIEGHITDSWNMSYDFTGRADYATTASAGTQSSPAMTDIVYVEACSEVISEDGTGIFDEGIHIYDMY